MLCKYSLYQILGEWCLKMSPWINFCKFMEFKNRSAIPIKEVVTLIAHARIPGLGIGLPGVPGTLVGVFGHVASFTIKKKCAFFDISGRIIRNIKGASWQNFLSPTLEETPLQLEN
jgi:hypothetical protein